MNSFAPWIAMLFAFVAGLWVRDVWRERKPAYGLERERPLYPERRRAY